MPWTMATTIGPPSSATRTRVQDSSAIGLHSAAWDTHGMRVLRLIYSAALRGLATLGGAVAAYGATGMFTSGVVMPPNALVIAGLALCVLAGAALWRSERRVTGLWPALLISAIPYSLYALSSLRTTECPQPHPPLTPTYTCAPVGSDALAIASPLLALLGLALLLLDLHATARSVRGRAASG